MPSPPDSWHAFVPEALGARTGAFYLERAPSPGRAARWAMFGTHPLARKEWSRPSDVEDFRQAFDEGRRSSTPPLQVGFVGFDAFGLFEPLLRDSTPRDGPFPLAEFHTYEKWERHPVRPRTDRTPIPALESLELGRVIDSSSPNRFGASVNRLKEDILNGEAFQVVLAHRRERTIRGSLLSLVDRLRRLERYAYLYYWRGGPRGEFELAGASPESVVEVREGNIAISPIAGTRPRPPPPTGPRARLPLKRDPKELAEHRMLVDLARNDIGRVARTGSVRISRTEVRVPYRRLEHLETRVIGTLPREHTALDALMAAFPAGTVSGAPKIRATELLRREERTWRGPYAGAVGFFHGPRNAEFALAIRSAFACEGKVYTAAGAGIVHASLPRREWEETLVKLSTLEDALSRSAPPPERPVRRGRR